MTEPRFIYRAYVTNIVDGDTFDLDIDLGMCSWLSDQRIRLHEIDTPEMRGPERVEGLKVTEFVSRLMPVGTEVVLETVPNRHEKDSKGKWGRWLAIIHLPDGSTLNETLKEMGYEHVY